MRHLPGVAAVAVRDPDLVLARPRRLEREPGAVGRNLRVKVPAIAGRADRRGRQRAGGSAFHQVDLVMPVFVRNRSRAPGDARVLDLGAAAGEESPARRRRPARATG